jgi:hypothetical protein
MYQEISNPIAMSVPALPLLPILNSSHLAVYEMPSLQLLAPQMLERDGEMVHHRPMHTTNVHVSESCDDDGAMMDDDALKPGTNTPF